MAKTETFTVKLVADVKKFTAGILKATQSMAKMGMMNRGLIKNMQTMSKAARHAGRNMGSAQQKLQNGLTRTNKAVNKGKKGWSGLFKTLALGTVVIGGLTTAIYGLVKAWVGARQAAEVQVQAKAFANLANSYAKSSKALMDGLREASKGTVNDMQLMTTASRALLLGIPIGKLTELMEVARGASKAMGTTVSGAFSDISLGIGRQSRLILDNLGIIVRVGSAYATYAARIGTTADALTDFEKKQAFAIAAIQAGKENVERSNTGLIDFQDRLAQVQTVVENTALQWKSMFLAIFITIEEFLIDSGLAGEMKKLFEVTFPNLLLEQIDDLIFLLDKLGSIIKQLNEVGIKETAKNIAGNFARDYIDGAKLYGKELLNDILGTNPFGLKNKGFVPSRTAVDRNIPIPETGEPLEEPVKELSKEAKVASARLTELKARAVELQKAMRGEATPTKSSIQLITENVEALNRALQDLEMSPQDLEKEFSIKMQAIADHIKLIQEGVGPQTPEVIAEQARLLPGLVKEYSRLEAIMSRKVRPESFLAGLGVLSETQFTRTAKQKLAQMKRIIDEGHLTDPVALRAAYDNILKEVLANVDRLTPELQAKLQALNTWMAKNAIPNDSIREGLNQWVDDYRNTTDRMKTIGMETAQAIATAFENFFFDSVTGQLKSLEQTLIGFGKSVLRSVSKGLGQKATEEILRLTGIAPGKNTKANNAPLISALNRLTLAVSGKATVLGGQTSGLQSAGVNPVVGTVLTQTGAIQAQQQLTQQAHTTMMQSVKSMIKSTFSTMGSFIHKLFNGLTNLLGGLLGAFSAPGKGVVGMALQGFGAGTSGFLGTAASAIGSILPFAKGGITSLASGAGDSAMVTKKPTIAAISERGQREAIVPLDKFNEMLKPITMNINAVDTKSFAQFMHDNKEIVLGSLMAVKGSTAISNMNAFNKGPF